MLIRLTFVQVVGLVLDVDDSHRHHELPDVSGSFKQSARAAHIHSAH